MDTPTNSSSEKAAGFYKYLRDRVQDDMNQSTESIRLEEPPSRLRGIDMRVDQGFYKMDKEVTIGDQRTDRVEQSTVRETPISKRRQKKLNRLEQIRETRKQKRKDERERRKQRRKNGPATQRKPIKAMKDSSCKQRIAIDLQFQDKMSEKDRMQLSKQLMFCYAANRRSSDPCQLYMTSAKGDMMDRLRKMSCQNWDVNLKCDHLLDIFDKQDIVYLTSESENELLTLDERAVYVIGGLVDHNSLKSFCKSYATEQGLRHARLPIDRFIAMKTRRVLTVNHVMEILTSYLQTSDWSVSLERFIPARTGFSLLADRVDQAVIEAVNELIDNAAGDGRGSVKTERAVEQGQGKRASAEEADAGSGSKRARL